MSSPESPIQEDSPSPTVEAAPAGAELAQAAAPLNEIQSAKTKFLLWVLMGSGGLRAGWSIVLFVLLTALASSAVGFVFSLAHLLPKDGHATADAALFGELIWFLGIVAAAAVVALVERRRGNLLAFNLDGPRRVSYFVQGLVAGFAALSLLVGVLHWGGWLSFGPIALSGMEIAKFAALWGIAFLLVGCVEEGIFRCYLQFTLTRGINLWWALGIVALICGFLLLRSRGNGVWGVYAVALIGLGPCLWLHVKKAESAGFWLAAWVTSTIFGFIHTGNGGENWIGIFAAALIGFVFVVSVRVTGSAWWAIGCHAAWDWAETYFYGTADSGMVATGHYLTATPAGKEFWSGGADGPEGSVLVIAVVLVLLVAIVVLYGRKKPLALAAGLEQATE